MENWDYDTTVVQFFSPYNILKKIPVISFHSQEYVCNKYGVFVFVFF